jgi:hypothetical protein
MFLPCGLEMQQGNAQFGEHYMRSFLRRFAFNRRLNSKRSVCSRSWLSGLTLVSAISAYHVNAEDLSESLVQKAAAASLTPAQVVGFESAGAWGISGGTLSLVSSPKKEGQKAAKVVRFRNAVLTSAAFRASSPLLNTLSIGVRLDGVPARYAGSIGVSVRAPSLKLQWTRIGTKSIAGLARGAFSTLSMTVPVAVRSKLSAGASDLQFQVQITSSRTDQVITLDDMVIFDTSPPAELPWWLSYCSDDATCGTPLVVKVCPTSNPNCSPKRQTTITPTLDNRRFLGLFLPINLPNDRVLVYVSGSGVVQSSLVTSDTGQVLLRSDDDLTLSYYGVKPVWGGTTHLRFVSDTLSSPDLVTTVFRHESYLTAKEPAELHHRSLDIVQELSDLTQIWPGTVRSSLLPSELVTSGEGNYSDGNRWITTNYGNPDWIEYWGGGFDTALAEVAHEFTHELFQVIAQDYPGQNACLSEGLADALPFVTDNMPEDWFGPFGQRGSDFDQGCVATMNDQEIHEVGNCPLWQVHRLGQLTPDFVSSLFYPKHVISFDSCDLNSSRTGNALLVLYSDAAGHDMAEAIDMAGIPNAGSYTTAKAALGLP